MAAVRVGFLGAGLIATFHSRMLRRSGEEFHRAGVHDPDPSRAEVFARASGSTVCDSEEEVLDSCDAVYVCTWTSEHPRLVDAAVDRGLAVFCEKPLATTLAEARRMRQAVEAAHARLRHRRARPRGHRGDVRVGAIRGAPQRVD